MGFGLGASSGSTLCASRYLVSIRSKLPCSASAISGRFSRLAEQHRRRLDGGQTVTARLAAQLPIARRMRRAQDDALAFQHPRVAPPQRLGLAPGAVEQHDAFDIPEDGALIVFDFTLAVDGDDIPVGFELGDLGGAEIQYRPAAGIVDRPSQCLGKARPRQSDLQHRVLEMQGGQPRGAERPVLLLRMLQDQQRNAAFDRRNAVADA